MWLLLNFQSSMRQALQRLLDEAGETALSVTKGAISQARQKVKASALVALNDLVVAEAKPAGDNARWMGHRLLAVDGSSLRLNDPQLVPSFSGQRHRRGVRPLARVGVVFDVLNRLIVGAALASWRQGERALFGQLLGSLRADDLVLMDRGYPALWLFALLQSRGVQFCARLDYGLWAATTLLAQHGGSELCYVARLTERAQALCAAHGVGLTEIKLRVLRVRLPNGQYEYLVTSLLDAERYPQHLFADLYARRWAVEEALKFLKRRVLVENFTGRNELAVQQDFHARVLLANLTQLFALASDRRIRKADHERGQHLAHQTNRAWALAQVRHFLPRWLLRPTLALVREILHRLASAPEAIRPARAYPRNKPRMQRGFSFAYKPVA